MTTYTINKWDSHRNGVGGDPFYLLDLTLTEEGHSVNLLVVLSTEEQHGSTTQETRCYVINPQDIEDRYRGDRIAYDLMQMGIFQKLREEAIEKWQRK
jgi:hypothetical protein